MPGHVSLDSKGLLSGHARRRLRLAAAETVEVRMDGRPLARVHTGPDGFRHWLGSTALDGKLHEVRTRITWGGGELEGSPLAWEARRPDAPERAFVLQGSAAALDGDASVSFDPRRSELVVAAPGRLAQNRQEIGGLAEHGRYRPWPAYLARFRGVYADAAFGGVYRSSGEIWQGSSYLLNTWARQKTSMQMLADKLAPAPARTCLVFCNSVKDTYFHWHLDCLTGLVMARERNGREATAIGPPLNSWQRASLQLLGESVVEMEDACRPDTTLVPCHVDGRGIYPDRWVVRLFERLKAARNAQVGTGGRRGGRRLFVSRRDAGHRVLANEDALWDALKGRGFERFTPGEASYEAQIDAFAGAEVVVASHGSALTNMGFCRKGATVVEILPLDYVNGCFRYLAIALGLRHGWYSTERTDPFEVEVDRFMDWCAAERLF